MHKHFHFAETAAESTSVPCTHQTFFDPKYSKEQLCTIARTDCDEQYDFVNFFMVFYCWLGGNWQLSIAVGLFIIFLIFRFISSVVEEYLAPAITYISEWLKLPEALAAVTLLALANGAGDVITALVASGSSDGLSYNIGSIYGAGLFVCSIVVAMTISNSPQDIQLEPSSIWRDVGFYIVATLSVIVFAFIGKLTITSACVMLGEYALLVLIVYIQERGKEKEENKEEAETESPKKNSDDKVQRLQEKDLIVFVDDKTEEEKKAESKKWKQTLSKMNTASAAKKMKLLTQKFKAVIYMAMKKSIKKEEENEFHDMSIVEKVLFIIDQPFNYARKITLPPCEPENYEKLWAVLFPAPGLVFLVFAATLTPKLWWLVLVLVGLIGSLIIYKTSPEKEPPKYYIALELFGAIGALLWTYLISGILIDLLNYLGMVSKLDTTYMGLTVIAVGNALPDAVTTIALAKQGYAIMGLTGAYAGQLFGLLVGFGIALLKKTIQEGPQDFNLFDPNAIKENLMNNVVIMVSLLNLVITFIYGVANKYRYSKTLARIIGALYVTFMVGSTIYAIYMAMH